MLKPVKILRSIDTEPKLSNNKIIKKTHTHPNDQSNLPLRIRLGPRSRDNFHPPPNLAVRDSSQTKFQRVQLFPLPGGHNLRPAAIPETRRETHRGLLATRDLQLQTQQEQSPIQHLNSHEELPPRILPMVRRENV
jgi:hypothetical protein